uniref:Uncharacterized protein n=1 Tax=Anguilla anguilla TaxID=7936 RepID=A0A0E9R2L5_ANGAN
MHRCPLSMNESALPPVSSAQLLYSQTSFT